MLFRFSYSRFLILKKVKGVNIISLLIIINTEICTTVYDQLMIVKTYSFSYFMWHKENIFDSVF